MNGERRRVRHGFVAAVLLALALSAGAWGAEGAREANDRRFAAMVRGDLAELAGLLADDLTYVHSTGALETKEQLLAAISSGKTRYRSITPSEVEVRSYGEAAVVTGKVAMEVTANGKNLAFMARFTAVYARAGESWKLVAWQSTRVEG